MIRLVEDTIDKKDIEQLIQWLGTNPKLTKGELTVEFEKNWSDFLKCKYSVFINSGSSANLAMFYSLMISNRLKNKKIIVPAVSWVTTVSPVIQFGLEPIMCDCDKDNLGLDLNHLKNIIESEKPAALILVHVLGIPNHMSEIINLCEKNGVIILEDTCESIGSKYNSKNLGTFGLMSSFSFYFGHHMSTIEGGMICTDDEELYHILLSIRSHGWDRDLPTKKQKELREKYQINDFRALYTFYYPGFNLRSTDLQAFLGINQLKKIDWIIEQRNKNFNLYNEYVKESIWKIKPPEGSFVSNFAYPIITDNIEDLVIKLTESEIESRPLICGSMNEQPFWYNVFGKSNLPNAKRVHDFGMYLPNNPNLTKEKIEKITNIINKFT
jgi:CDP-6-deoxy-D-xylo-4-hexulose-3-dehydrase